MVFLIMTLEEARMTSYNISMMDGVPQEQFSLAYTAISVTHYNEGDDGEVKKGDVVKFDLATAKLVSMAKLP